MPRSETIAQAPAKTKKAPSKRATAAKETATPTKSTKTAKTKAVQAPKAEAKTPAKPRKPSAPKLPVAPAKGLTVGVGFKAPAFKLPTHDGGDVSLAKMKDQLFVLYFYPKDDTSGCTAEACGFRDALPKFDALGVKVIGVSKDPLTSHEKFARKFDLNFPLASDETGAVCEAYGVWIEKSMYGRKYMGIDRATFIIDGKGIIRAVWRHVSVPGHVETVRKALLSL